MAFPFESLDKAFLAGTQAPWASFAPVWRLEYRGTLTESQLVRALGFVLARYPWAAARVIDEAWVLPQTIDARAQFSVVDADPGNLADRFLELSAEPPLHLTWVRGSALVFQQHHSLADGRAFLALLADFVKCLDAESSPLPSGIVPRRREREVLPSRGPLVFLRGALHTVKELLLGNLRPLSPVFSNAGTDYSGGNRTMHLFVPRQRLEAWRERRTKRGLSMNDLLAAALCTAVSRLSKPGGVHNLFLPIDVRPREGFESFANHLSSMQLRWRPRSSVLALAQALKAAAVPLLAARLPWKRTLFDAWLVRLSPMALLRKTLLVKRQLLTNFSFSNLVPLGTPGASADGRWQTSAIVIDRVLITTPCTPPQAVNTTVIGYGDDVCFNFNFKDSAVSRADVEALVREFSAALDEVERTL